MRVLQSLTVAAFGALTLPTLGFAQGADECANATPITGLGVYALNTTGATTSGSSPCAGIGADVWFEWMATTTEAVEVITCGTASWDTALAVYGGTCGSLSLLNCDDDGCGSLQSKASFNAIAGSVYYIRAGAYQGGSSGVGQITLQQAGVITGGCANPTTGADVIVGDIPSVANYSAVGNMSAYSLATTSCNIGDAELLWISQSNQHPVIGQNIYRMENGRFEQIGMSWLKHGFTALQQNLCCDCASSGTGSRLGVGCSDPYGAGLNGSQSGLGPKSQVNAFTGAFPFPYAAQGQTGDAIYKRAQVPTADVDPALHPSALYFGESQYVSPDDAAAGNGFNNVSYTALERPGSQQNGTFRLNVGANTTVRELAAIRAWEAATPTVVMNDIMVPGEGMFVAGSNVIDNGDGTWNYEFAIFNNNSDLSGQRFTVPVGSGVTVSNVGMSFPMYHSGEPYSNASWTGTVNVGDVTWATETYLQNQNANALRWGTTYSFWFTANSGPQTVAATLGLFKPNSIGDQTVSLEGPADTTGGGAIITNYCATIPNSTGLSGAIIASNVDLGARTMDLDAINLPNNAIGYFITSTTQDFVANPNGSSGNLCLGGTDIGRGVAGGVQNTGTAGAISGIVNLDLVPTPIGTTSVMAGETRYFQLWHRDSIIGSLTSNFTNGVRVTFP